MKKVISVVIFASLLFFLSISKNEDIILETENVRTTTVVNSIVSSGFIEQRDKNLISIDTNGIVLSLNFKEGDDVKIGDTIMTIQKSDEVSFVSSFPTDFNMIGKSDILTTESEIITIKSNVSGKILSIPSSVGEGILRGVPFLSFLDDDEYIAKISIDERYANDLKIGQGVSLSSDAFEGTIYGEIESISPYAKKEFDILGTSSKVLIDATVRIFDDIDKIIPGISVLAKISINEKDEALVVPYTAVFQEENKEFVYVLGENIVEKRQIETGYALENEIEVISGLEISDILILNKNLEEGMKVFYE